MGYEKKRFPIILLAVASIFLLSFNLACAKKTQVKEDQIAGEVMGKGPRVESGMKVAAKPSPGEIKMETERVKEFGVEDKPFKDWGSPLKESSAKFEGISITDVNFAFDKYNLDDTAQQILSRNAAILKQNPNIQILIEGHADERGTEEYNLALGEKRATTVKNYLVTLGTDPNRIFTISYGEERPLVSGHSEEAWTKNRRAHFVITSQ